jgi:hypothetical protein
MIFLEDNELNLDSEQLDSLMADADAMGIDNDDSEFTVNFDSISENLEMSDEELGLNEHEDWEEGDAELVNEAGVKTSRKVVVKTKKQKMARLAQGAGMTMAKDAKDPLYKKYEKYRKLEVKFRAKIEKKYKSRGKAAARAAASGIKKKKKKA